MDPTPAQSATDLATVMLAIAAAVVLVAGAAGLLYRRRVVRSVPYRLRQAGNELLTNFLLPDVDTGQIHVAFAVLARQGIVVVDIREVIGHVFGSETMQEWTVLAPDRRFTFSNPLPALYDRVAAVRRVVPETPVRGVVAFTAGAEFSKGFPPSVVMLDALVAELADESATPEAPTQEQLRLAWAKLVQEASRARRA